MIRPRITGQGTEDGILKSELRERYRKRVIELCGADVVNADVATQASALAMAELWAEQCINVHDLCLIIAQLSATNVIMSETIKIWEQVYANDSSFSTDVFDMGSPESNGDSN